MAHVTRGFSGRGRQGPSADRLPPGQYDTGDLFPVLSAGPTPRTPVANWDLVVVGEVERPRRWKWDEFSALPHEDIVVDIHCVTKWSKFDTQWRGVSIDVLLEDVVTPAQYVTAFCDGGYTTNLPLEELLGGKAWVADGYGGAGLLAEHGGPARLLVPQLYFWKSAKWIRGLRLSQREEPGFWESLGYHNLGDPWREQRYAGD